jgi:hypothetical protein
MKDDEALHVRMRRYTEARHAYDTVKVVRFYVDTEGFLCLGPSARFAEDERLGFKPSDPSFDVKPLNAAIAKDKHAQLEKLEAELRQAKEWLEEALKY